MIPDQFFDSQGGFVFTLLLSRIGLALLYILIALLASWIVPKLVQRSVLKSAEIQVGGEISDRRRNTIARLMLYLTRGLIITAAVLAVMSLFVDSAGLFTFVGLFTAGFGFSIRQIISDYISGFIFLFEDPFAIGDDVQVSGERGKVKDVTLRTTVLRAPTGETRIVPNGDIRTVYNFTREDFGLVDVRVNVPSAQLTTAFAVLEQMAQRLADAVPNLAGSAKVLAEDAALGSAVTLTVRVRARSGSQDEVRRRLLEAIQQALAQSGVEIAE